MKQIKKRTMSIMLVLAMFITAVGCDQTQSNSEVNDPNNDNYFTESNNDDFFTDTTEVIDNTAPGANSGNTGNAANGQTSTTGNAQLTVKGKSWKDVLASMPKELNGTTVTLYNWNPISEYTGATAVIKDFESQTGIKVKWDTVAYGTYFTRLAALVASDDSPDVVRTRQPIPEQLKSFQPLSAADYDFTDDAWDQEVMKDYSVNGVSYATSLKGTPFGNVNLMYYNKSLISKYDLENPYTLWKNGKWTVSKFLEICREYRKATGKADTFGCVGFVDWSDWTMLYGYAGTIGFDGSKYYSNLSDPKFLTVSQEIADLWNTEKILGAGRAEVFDASETLFYSGNSIFARKKNSYFGTLKSAGQLYAVPMPSVDGQAEYYQGRYEYEAYAIASGAKNPKAVPYFLRYFLDGANYDLNAFFCNKQNLEAYTWAMGQKNTIWSTLYSGNGEFSNSENGATTKNSAQIKSFLDSNAALVQQKVDEYNNSLKTLSK